MAKKKKISKKKGASFNLALFLCVLAGVIVVSLLIKHHWLNTLNQNSHDVSTETLGPAYKEKLIWIPYVSGYESATDSFINFAMEIPYPGPYCSGCFGSTAGVTNMSSQQVSGGYFRDISFKSKDFGKADWFLDTDVYSPQANYGEFGFWRVPNANFYQEISKHSVGETFILYDGSNREHNLTRFPDRKVDGNNFLIFSYDKPFQPHNKTGMITVFQKSGYLGLISFEYGNDLYKDTFGHMLNTFRFTTQTSTDSLETLKADMEDAKKQLQLQ